LVQSSSDAAATAASKEDFTNGSSSSLQLRMSFFAAVKL